MTPDHWHDDLRLPDLTESGIARLRLMTEHPSAPAFSGRSGHHLNPQDLMQLLAEKPLLQAAPDTNTSPDWLAPYVADCLARVPAYRRYGTCEDFQALPFTDRQQLSKDIAAFVPDDLPLGRMIAYETSGTTGHPLTIPSHPRVAARYHCFHEQALGWHGISLAHAEGDIGVMLAGDQERCFTYVSVVPYWQQKGLVKLNLNPADWPSEADRGRYIDSLKPILITGDPRSLATLLTLPFSHCPVAILSTSMTLLQGLKSALEARFGCPVINLYSMNEAGPIAASDGQSPGLRLLQPRLYVEIIGADGRPKAYGERGEICITGGFNDYLPLLRYRTGDHASLRQEPNGALYLDDLDGRPPVRYHTQYGWLNNVDMTHSLQPFALAQYQLHQQACGAVVLRVRGSADQQALHAALAARFGPAVAITVLTFQHLGDKTVQYTSDYPEAMR
ncbi:MAG: hypothetical protein LAT63_09400 [Marinobacter sp.]|nr:hypothetical protein [Marinobacter sp.]